MKSVLTAGFTRMRALEFAGSFDPCSVPLSAHPVTFFSVACLPPGGSPRCFYIIKVAEKANVSRRGAKIVEIDGPAAINVAGLRPI